MKLLKAGIFCNVIILVIARFALAEVDSMFHCYLLFGQSNMAGGAAGQYDGEGTRGVDDYCDTNPRVKVLAWGDCDRAPYPCPDKQLKRTHDQWYTAFPPLHNCHEGIGPADGFARTLLDSLHDSIKIGFIPCALSGEAIETFQKGSGKTIADHTQPAIGGGQKLSRDAYGWMVKRCKIAQETGVIKGILLHQGEANNGDQGWPDKVKGIVDNLKKDLGLWDSIPVIAGEMRYDGCCPAHNPIVNKLPAIIPNCKVASAKDIERRLSRPDGQYDQYHFSTKGTKEFGYRYGVQFLSVADSNWVMRKGQGMPVAVSRQGMLSARAIVMGTEPLSIYTLDGRIVAGLEKNHRDIKRYLRSGTVYIVSSKAQGNRNFVVPVVTQTSR